VLPPIRYPNSAAGLGSLGDAKSVAQVLGAVGRSQLRRVVVRSTISPDVEIDLRQTSPRNALHGGVGELVFGVIKPTVYVDTGIGQLMAIAPWGEPRRNYLPILIPLMALGVGTLGWLVWRGLTR